MSLPEKVVSIQGERLEQAKQRIIAAHGWIDTCAPTDWPGAAVQLVEAYSDTRKLFSTHTDFTRFLNTNQINFYCEPDRLALIFLGSNMELARKILQESHTHSFQKIWKSHKDQFTYILPPRKPKPKKPVATLKSGRYSAPRTIMTGRAMNHRRMKLGDETIDKLWGTSLGRADELDELVMLNRGVPLGEHTPLVARLIADALAGKDVSAIVEGRKLTLSGRLRKVPTLQEAWRKRMITAWEQATKSEQEKFVDYLIDHVKKS